MKSLPYLDLELMPTRMASRAKGWAVLAIGVIALLFVITHDVLLRQKIDVIENSEATTGPIQKKPGSVASSAEIKAINSSIEQLSLPWTALFAALEGVDVDAVNLLAIEPNPQKGSVNIVAEAPDVYAMLEYQRGLKAQPDLHDVTLVQYETRLTTNAETVRFTMSAGWGMTR